ncbi:PhzF family phenazine biosynthesis protein [Microbacterium sp. LX3-4]|uniref:PhzF family phenazine biosynthesis protein n=2 Tax=Microbacterium dauci TaxID=3048008 RepID=A0ABT6ZG54_9MICO|nr:PhzF family phenazine biosynthesis protein [Microbacterium sp. LX3-4]
MINSTPKASRGASGNRDALDRVDHDADALLGLQNREGRDSTVPIVWREDRNTFVSRNPFPRGGINEDPATGSAAASLGAHLRWLGAHAALVQVHQGSHIGVPSLITVEIPDIGRARVSGRVA